METILLFIISGVCVACLILLFISLLKKPKENAAEMQQQLQAEMRTLRQENEGLQSALRQEIGAQFEVQSRTSLDMMARMNEQTMQNLESVRTTLDRRLEGMRQENEKSMEKIRQTVDKELSETLSAGLDNSFKSVSTQLEQVFTSMGEMRTMASDISGLKNVLANVKNRGTWGEVQLGAILEDIFTPSQYEAQCMMGSGRERVDYAIKLPGNGDSIVYLPIDAKFPMDRYTAVTEAEQLADADAVAVAKNMLVRTVTDLAKDIAKKYIAPPQTTDFAILFVPSEGMYATLAAEDMAFTLQRDHKILLAGPTTLGALLNSIQIGFRTISIEKRADDIMQLLGAIKSTFGNFSRNLDATQKSLVAASNNLEKATGSSRRILQRLRTVEEVDLFEAQNLLGEDMYQLIDEVDGETDI